MTKLKLGLILANKPVKVTVVLSAVLARDLTLYTDYLNRRHIFVSLLGVNTCLN